MRDDKLLQEIRQNMKLAIEKEQDNRESHLEDVKFENGHQWDEKTKTDRETDGRPCITVNKVSGVVRQIIGDARQNKIQIKVRPIDDNADTDTAKVFTGLIRNIENVSNSDIAYQNALSCSARGGWGYFRVVTDYLNEDVFEQDISIERVVNPLSVYFDPTAQKVDLADAKWCFVTDKMRKEDFEEEYPKATTSAAIESAIGDDTQDWISDTEVRVAEYFKVKREVKTLYLLANGKTVKKDSVDAVIEQEDGSLVQINNDLIPVIKERETTCRYVEWYKTNGLEILEKGRWAGKWIPIIPVLGDEIWIEGKRILRSAIKWAKDPNRLYNWARSTSVETISMAPKQPFILTPDEIAGHETQWNQAHRKSFPYLLHNPAQLGRPTRQQASIPDMGAIQETIQAADDIKSTTGLFDASLGAGGNETSGKAILARQREGDTATYLFIDNLVYAINHLGRILVDLIPKIYDTQRVVRLLNQDGSEGWAEINIEDPVTGEKTNDITIGKYDVLVTAGPAYNTKRIEAADGMIRLAEAAPMYMPVIAPRLAKNLDWPEADEISEEMQAMHQPQEQGPSPEDQLKAEKEMVTIEGKQLDNAKKTVELTEALEGNQEQMVQIARSTVIEALQQVGMLPT